MTSPRARPDYTFDLPVPENLLQAIGMIAVEWARLKSVIEGAIGSTGYMTEEIAATVARRAQWKPRLEMLAELYAKHLESFTPESDRDQAEGAFRGLCERVEALAPQRNQFVHSRWVRGDGGSPYGFVLQTWGKLTREKRAWTPQMMHDVAAEIQQLTRDVAQHFDIPMEPNVDEDEG
jgi:hypothetical protein